MKTTTWRIAVIGVMALAGVGLAWDAGAEKADRDELLLSVESVEKAPGSTVDVPVSIEPRGSEPSALSMSVILSATEKVEYPVASKGVAPGPAAEEANKSVESNVVSSTKMNLAVADGQGVIGEEVLAYLQYEIGEDAQIGETYTVELIDYSASDPDANSISTTVQSGEITITDEPDPYPEVPAVLGMSQEDAEAAFTDAGFEVGEVTYEYHDTAPEEEVIGVEPDVGTELEPGSIVNLVLSQGPEDIIGHPEPEVPAVLGGGQEEAELAIELAGLEVGEVTHEYHDTAPEGEVIGVEPDVGTELEPGSTVILTVSQGPDPEPDDDDHGASMKMLRQDVYEKVLPAEGDEESWPAYAPEQDVYLRLKADAPIDPDTLWVSAYGEDGREIYLPSEWRPTKPEDDRDGWATAILPEPAPDGESFLVVAEALVPETGETVAQEAMFEVTKAAEAKEILDAETALVEDDAVEPLPEVLAAGASPVYRISPAKVFEEPQTVRLPVDGDPADLDIYYYSESPEHEGWYRGERVIGWLVSDSVRTVDEDGAAYLEFEVNHSGVMQLGRDVSAKLGSLGMPGFRVTGHPAQWLALVAMLALTAWAAVPRRRGFKR
ncbi:MAG: PASTA domain-containing protein [Candidatus Hydrogenedentota bacterium]